MTPGPLTTNLAQQFGYAEDLVDLALEAGPDDLIQPGVVQEDVVAARCVGFQAPPGLIGKLADWHGEALRGWLKRNPEEDRGGERSRCPRWHSRVHGYGEST